jgi:putative ABC transport system permease protein
MIVLFENILLALEGLRANKMRALLTMLGIIIGISSVIGIVTVGDSLSASVSENMQSLGATNIIMIVSEKRQEYNGDTMMDPYSRNPQETDLITDDMLERFRQFYSNEILAVSTAASAGQGRAQDGRRFANVSEYGVNADYRLANNINMLRGRFLRDDDILSRRSVAVVSDKFINNIFPNGVDPLGKEIKISIRNTFHTFSVIGVYQYEQQPFAATFMPVSDRDIRTDVYIPISTVKMLTSASPHHRTVTVTAETWVDPVKFAGDIKNFFNTYFYASNPRFEVDTMSMESIMSTVTQMLGTISIAVAVIAGISLVVGGIGVMNIMLVSVTERTREIGTRKALGARNSAIRVQFIVEAIIICTIGGILGIMLGLAMAYVGSTLIGAQTAPSPTIITIAVLFSMMIGVFFGYYPANKAAKLDPIEALRYE